MEIVPFDIEHYEDCWLMGLEFFSTTKYKHQHPDKASVYAMFNLCRSSGISFVAVDESLNPIGMLLAIVDGLWINKDVKVSQEVMWWVDEEYRNTSAGMRLIKEYEVACEASNVSYIGMNLLSTSQERLKDWLARKGYEQMETSFVKEIV